MWCTSSQRSIQGPLMVVSKSLSSAGATRQRSLPQILSDDTCQNIDLKLYSEGRLCIFAQAGDSQGLKPSLTCSTSRVHGLPLQIFLKAMLRHACRGIYGRILEREHYGEACEHTFCLLDGLINLSALVSTDSALLHRSAVLLRPPAPVNLHQPTLHHILYRTVLGCRTAFAKSSKTTCDVLRQTRPSQPSPSRFLCVIQLDCSAKHPQATDGIRAILCSSPLNRVHLHWPF